MGFFLIVYQYPHRINQCFEVVKFTCGEKWWTLSILIGFEQENTNENENKNENESERMRE
jgi:hypothetical protein